LQQHRSSSLRPHLSSANPPAPHHSPSLLSSRSAAATSRASLSDIDLCQKKNGKEENEQKRNGRKKKRKAKEEEEKN
jgi:hypothetical protein